MEFQYQAVILINSSVDILKKRYHLLKTGKKSDNGK